MPCRDYYDDNPGAYYKDTIEGLRKQVSFAESALCAALRHIESAYHADPVQYVDCKSAGIKPKELKAWFENHKALDDKHRAEAEEKARVHKLRNEALSKLTAEEKKVLGVK